MDRRQFLESTLSAGIAALLVPAMANAEPQGELKIAPFRFDVTPPVGHSLCGGWIKPAVAVDDPLEAIGFVLTGAGEPIVICTVDWTGLLNRAHLEWRTALAAAAGTSPDRVAVQCVHQHNAPFVCLDAQQIVAEQANLPGVVDLKFFESCLERGRTAVQQALQHLQSVTHVATGQAKVEKVAGNRRILNAGGKLETWRGSSSKNPQHWELPEGLIDPWMKEFAFYNQKQKLVACYYYATHPMSYYGDGRVTSDFVGLARKRRQSEAQDCTAIYFTGCSGNVAAGKYNNGSPEARVQLTERIDQAMLACDQNLQTQSINSVRWQTEPLTMVPSASLNETTLTAQIADGKLPNSTRIISAMKLAWLRRCQAGLPIVLSALHVNQTSLLHLPAECFVEFQLRAQQSHPDRFVATAAYGDGGAWYIPTADAFPQGGYEVGVAFCSPETDRQMTAGTQTVLG